jgi:hypothetical protein
MFAKIGLPIIAVCISLFGMFYLTPVLVYLLDVFIRMITGTSSKVNSSVYSSHYKIGSIYVPEYFKHFVRWLYSFKQSIKPAKPVEHLGETKEYPLRDNTVNMVNSPRLKLSNNELPSPSHLHRILSHTKGRNNQRRT